MTKVTTHSSPPLHCSFLFCVVRFKYFTEAGPVAVAVATFIRHYLIFFNKYICI